MNYLASMKLLNWTQTESPTENQNKHFNFLPQEKAKLLTGSPYM